MSHLFYEELSGTTGEPIVLSGDPDLALFTCILGGAGSIDVYWSNAVVGSDLKFTFAFGFNTAQGRSGRVKQEYRWTNYDHAWPVHDGDIGLVPEPSTALLVGLGLAALGARRRAAWNETRKRP